MYRAGHWGISLLLFAPIGGVLVLLGRTDVALLTGGVMVWLSMLPDVDMRVPLLPHRGPTHSLAFALLVGVVFGGVGWLASTEFAFADRVAIASFSAFVGVVTILAHLVADALTPTGVAFLWPVSSRRYTLSVARADNVVANYLLLAVGAAVTVATLWFASRM